MTILNTDGEEAGCSAGKRSPGGIVEICGL